MSLKLKVESKKLLQTAVLFTFHFLLFTNWPTFNGKYPKIIKLGLTRVQIVARPIYWAAADKSARYSFLGGQSSFDDNYDPSGHQLSLDI